MKPEQQIKALAELDDPQHKWEVAQFPHNEGRVGYRYPAHDGWIYAPNYLTSYDAIIPSIQNQSLTVKGMIAKCLADITRNSGVSALWQLSATPAQLCEALLRATGRWKE